MAISTTTTDETYKRVHASPPISCSGSIFCAEKYNSECASLERDAVRPTSRGGLRLHTATHYTIPQYLKRILEYALTNRTTQRDNDWTNGRRTDTRDSNTHPAPPQSVPASVHKRSSAAASTRANAACVTVRRE